MTKKIPQGSSLRNQVQTPTNKGKHMATPFEAPATIEGSSVRPADLNGHLLIIKPLEYKTGIATQLGVAEAIEVDLVDLDTNEEHSSVLFFNIALRNALKPNIGKQVLARIGQGTAKPGKSAPWILVNATENQADVAKATAYLAGQVQAPTPVPQAAPAASIPAEIAASGVTPEVAALLAQLGAQAVK